MLSAGVSHVALTHLGGSRWCVRYGGVTFLLDPLKLEGTTGSTAAGGQAWQQAARPGDPDSIPPCLAKDCGLCRLSSHKTTLCALCAASMPRSACSDWLLSSEQAGGSADDPPAAVTALRHCVGDAGCGPVVLISCVPALLELARWRGLATLRGRVFAPAPVLARAVAIATATATSDVTPTAIASTASTCSLSVGSVCVADPVPRPHKRQRTEAAAKDSDSTTKGSVPRDVGHELRERHRCTVCGRAQASVGPQSSRASANGPVAALAVLTSGVMAVNIGQQVPVAVGVTATCAPAGRGIGDVCWRLSTVYHSLLWLPGLPRVCTRTTGSDAVMATGAGTGGGAGSGRLSSHVAVPPPTDAAPSTGSGRRSKATSARRSRGGVKIKTSKATGRPKHKPEAAKAGKMKSARSKAGSNRDLKRSRTTPGSKRHRRAEFAKQKAATVGAGAGAGAGAGTAVAAEDTESPPAREVFGVYATGSSSESKVAHAMALDAAMLATADVVLFPGLAAASGVTALGTSKGLEDTSKARPRFVSEQRAVADFHEILARAFRQRVPVLLPVGSAAAAASDGHSPAGATSILELLELVAQSVPSQSASPSLHGRGHHVLVVSPTLHALLPSLESTTSEWLAPELLDRVYKLEAPLSVTCLLAEGRVRVVPAVSPRQRGGADSIGPLENWQVVVVETDDTCGRPHSFFEQLLRWWRGCGSTVSTATTTPSSASPPAVARGRTDASLASRARAMIVLTGPTAHEEARVLRRWSPARASSSCPISAATTPTTATLRPPLASDRAEVAQRIWASQIVAVPLTPVCAARSLFLRRAAECIKVCSRAGFEATTGGPATVVVPGLRCSQERVHPLLSALFGVPSRSGPGGSEEKIPEKHIKAEQATCDAVHVGDAYVWKPPGLGLQVVTPDSHVEVDLDSTCAAARVDVRAQYSGNPAGAAGALRAFSVPLAAQSTV